MAEDYTSTDYGALGSGVSIRKLDKWSYTPFYKRHVFTGPSQFDQAANLMTSQSFRDYWSQGMTRSDLLDRFGRFVGGSLPETVTGIRVDNRGMDFDVAQRNAGRTDAFTWTNGSTKSNSPNPNITFIDRNGNEIQGRGRVPSRTYWDLRNQAGALPEEERTMLGILKYREPVDGLTRYVSNNSSDDLLGLSEELRLNSTARTLNARYPATIKTRDGWGAKSLQKSDELLSINAMMEIERNAIIAGEPRPSSLTNSYIAGKFYESPALDLDSPINEPKPRAFAMPSSPSEERNVGKIRRDVVTGVSNGKTWTDPLPTTTTTVYGPPEKYAALRTAGRNAFNVAQTGASYGMSGLALYGAIDSGLSVPARHEAYQRGGNNWLLSQAGAQADAMVNFMTLGAYDANRYHTGGTRGDYRGEMSNIQTPRLGLINEQSVHANPNRYERQGISFEHAVQMYK